MFKVLKQRELNKQILAKAGEVVYEWSGPDYGQASLESFLFQKPFISVSSRRNVGPFFTIALEDIERI